jgi:putative transposase
VVVTAASISDPKGARLLFARLGGGCKKLRRIWVDLQPVLRSDDMKGFVVLPRRWVVERTFAWLTQCRRLSKDYEVDPIGTGSSLVRMGQGFALSPAERRQR